MCCVSVGGPAIQLCHPPGQCATRCGSQTVDRLTLVADGDSGAPVGKVAHYGAFWRTGGARSTPTDSSNQTTAWTYDGDNNLTSMTAVMPSGEASQTTSYVYGVSPATGSGVFGHESPIAKL